MYLVERGEKLNPQRTLKTEGLAREPAKTKTQTGDGESRETKAHQATGSEKTQSGSSKLKS